MRPLLRWYFKRVRRNVAKRGTKTYLKDKVAARALVLERLEHFKTIYPYPYNRVSIKNQVSRWGSCSEKGNLNFNYRIVHLPPHLADYVIVHELCHLWEFNHSQKFWDLVAVAVPDYKAHREELRKVQMR